MQLTIDSKEPLGRVLEVVGSLYGVALSIAEGAAVPAATAGNGRRTAKKAASGASAPRSGRGGTSKTARAAKASAPEVEGGLAAVREWARAHGHTVSDRGRVSNAVLEAYRQSNSG